MIKRMVIMLLAAGILFGAIFGYHAYKASMMKKSMASFRPPPATVSTIKAEYQTWQPELKAVGSLRAVRGVDVTSEVSGLVQTVFFTSGDDAKEGQALVQLNADTDIAKLHSLQAEADLAKIVYDRDSKQFAAQAISRAVLDSDAADLKNKRALAAQQAALVEKKTIRAPFGGRLGITTVNPGQFVNPGDNIVTLQSLDSIYADFYLPQQDLSRISLGQKVTASTDTYPGRTFRGTITAINPKVETSTRNVQVEATITNPRHELLPGMFATVVVRAGKVHRYLTLPQTAVTYNPYGDTVFVVEEKGKGPEGKPVLIARQTFVTVGPTRGDQVAILKGIKEGEIVVTSGQVKLKNGSRVTINNKVRPSNEANPKPVDE
ncbi:MAG: efflux RND transporter periplasmic adaptor subunit [Candidatus Sulfobium sp.]|jgi:membrane fusion protein (multidrug efflux system)